MGRVYEGELAWRLGFVAGGFGAAFLVLFDGEDLVDAFVEWVQQRVEQAGLELAEQGLEGEQGEDFVRGEPDAG